MSDDALMFRDEVLKVEEEWQDASLMRFFVSVEWMVHFLSHVEPGPINNQYFLCRHASKKYFTTLH